MKPVHCSWVDMQKIRASLSNGKRGNQKALEQMRCVDHSTVSTWKAVSDVMQVIDGKCELTHVSEFQPTHAVCLARAFRKRYGKDAAQWNADELVEWIEHCEGNKQTVEQFDADLKADGRKKAAAEAAKGLPKGDLLGVRAGDFREVAKDLPDGSVSLIFTDPPYAREYLPLYADLGAIAARILKPGGSLITYLGQYALPEVCEALTPHLHFLWPLCCLHTGQSARMDLFGIVVKWKPMLWFVKDSRFDKLTYVDDLVESKQEKDAHEWQQGIAEARYYVDKLTLPGELIFDPFCGGGTTATAAKELKRKWLTCDVDESCVILARSRIYDSSIP